MCREYRPGRIRVSCLAGAVPLRIGYRFAGPVTGMLVKAGQRVKYGAFSDIRIAREGNDFIVRVLSFDFQARNHGLQADRAVCQTHPEIPFQRASMRMPLQSSERDCKPEPRRGSGTRTGRRRGLCRCTPRPCFQSGLCPAAGGACFRPSAVRVQRRAGRVYIV